MNKESKGNIFDLVVNQIGMTWLQVILACTKPSSPTFVLDNIVTGN